MIFKIASNNNEFQIHRIHSDYLCIFHCLKYLVNYLLNKDCRNNFDLEIS